MNAPKNRIAINKKKNPITYLLDFPEILIMGESISVSIKYYEGYIFYKEISKNN